MADEVSDKVGLGVDLIGGAETLAMLKSIRAEMTAITQLSGGRGGGTTPSSEAIDLRAREKVFGESNKRIAEDRVRTEKRTSQEEVEIMARAANAKQDLNRRINQRAEQLRNEEKQRQIAAAREEAQRHARFLADRKARVEAASQQEGILDRNLAADRRRFRAVRNDPAARNDPTTQQWRRDLAENIQAQRVAIREQNRLASEEAALNKKRDDERQREVSRARKAEIERRASDPAILTKSLPLPSKYRSGQEDLELNLAAQKLARRRQQDAADQAAWEKDQAARKARSAEQRRQFDFDMAIKSRQFQIEDAVGRAQNQASKRAADQAAQGILGQGQASSHVEVYRDVSRRRQEMAEIIRLGGLARNQAYQENAPVAKLNALEREQKSAIALYQQLTAAESKFFGKAQGGGFGGGGFAPPGGRGPGSGGRGPQRPRFGDPDAVINPSGFFTSLDAISRISRNILLYEVVSRASYALSDYISNSITAAKTTVEYANALRFATERAGGNVAENLKLADSLGDIGLSRQQGRKAVVEAARFAENRPQDTERLVRVVTNIAAERGDGIDRTDELIEQLRRRESKFYKRIFGKTVESIYAEEAGRVVDSRTTNVSDNAGLYKGLKPNEFKSRSDQIKEYVASMDDLAKENAVFNYILSQQSKFSGEAEVRAQTLAGRLDKLSAAFLNGQEGLGLFITDLKLFSTIVDSVTSKAKFLDSLRGPTLGRTGAGGTISNEDIERFGTETAYGSRARALRTVDTALPLLAGGAVALGGLAVLGRRRAQAQAQANVYDEAFQRGIRNNFTEAAAATEAAFKAQNTRATVGQQIKAGVERVTSNVAARVNETLYTVSDAVGATRVAGRAARRAGQLRGEIGIIGEQQIPGLAGARAFGAAGGGAIGGYAGATIASFVADKITSNEIIATGITILGGVAGSAVGTALGSAAGGAIAGRFAVGGAGLFGIGGSAGYGALAGAGIPAALLGGAIATGVAGGNILERILTGSFGGSGQTASEAERAREAEFARGAAYRQQAKERADLFATGRVRYRSTQAGGPTGLLTGSELAARGDAIGNQKGGFLNYLEVILPPLNEAERKIQEFTQAHDEAIKQINANEGLPDEIKKTRIAALDSELKQNIDDARSPEWAKFREEYRARQAESISKRLEADRKQAEKQRNEFLSQLTTALSKLRDAEQGSFRAVGDTATSLAGEDNPYVKVLSEQITLAERMKQQWGFLGDAAVKYFTDVEQAALSRQTLKLEYQTLQTTGNLRLQAGKERDQREGPGLSRREQDYLDIQSAIVAQAVQIPQIWAEAANILGRNISRQQEFAGRIGLISQAFGSIGPRLRNVYGQDITPDRVRRNALGQSLGGYFDIEPRRNALGQSLEDPATARLFGGIGAGESTEVRRALQKSFTETVLNAFQGLSPAEIRASGFQDLYFGALRQQGANLGTNIQEAREKALVGAREDARLSAQLQVDDNRRRELLRQGYNPQDVGREADALLLARTEGVSPKDLTLQQFTARQDALRRQAERAEADRQEAKDAVQKGLEAQKLILDTVKDIRDAVTGGNMSMLVQVQNDTQARIDQENLQELATGNYNVPLDQGQAKSNPYTGSFTRYKRGGRKR